MKLLIYDDINELTVLHSISDLELEHVKLQDNPEVVFVRSKDLKQLTLPKSLVAIGRAGSGVDNIPIDWCNQNGVAVFNAPGENANAVKELVLAALVLASRPAFQAANALIKHPEKPEELKKLYKGLELAGAGIRVIGMGAIGSKVAKMCVDLGMEVFGYDPYLKNFDTLNGAIKVISDLKALRKQWTRYITLHCYLDDNNRGMIDGKFFSAGVKIINFARAELVNEQELLEELETGRVSAYVSDFVPKKVPIDKFFKLGNAIFLPHLGASTYESETRATEKVATRVNDFFYQGICRGSVNLPDMPEEKVEPGRVRILVSNWDKPGIIERVTKIVSEAGLNIGSMTNRSRKDSGLALNYIDVDLENPNSRSLVACDAIKEIEGVTRVRITKHS